MSNPSLEALLSKGWTKFVNEGNGRVWYKRPDGTSVHATRNLKTEEREWGAVLFPGKGKKRPNAPAPPPGNDLPSQGPSPSDPGMSSQSLPATLQVSAEVEVATEVNYKLLMNFI